MLRTMYPKTSDGQDDIFPLPQVKVKVKINKECFASLEPPGINPARRGAKPSLKSKIYIYKAIADIKWASWAFIQDKLSALDFDFYKYGALKYLRARSFIISENWNKSLERIN